MTFILAISLFLPVVLSVAFITLIERKWLASTQRRVGPNSVGPLGLLQPFADALKLLTKENVVPGHANKILFYSAPIITLFFSLLGWVVIPFGSGVELIEANNSLIISLALSSLGIYGILLAGWSANSKYALLGSLRSTAQMISYELVFGSSVLCIVLLNQSWSLSELGGEFQTLWHGVAFIPLFIVYWISALAETNRAPMDLPEAESELVAGFFTEHSSVLFVMFFLAEYGSLILMSTLTVLLFFGGYMCFVNPFISSIYLGVKVSLITVVFVWIRSTLPRLRYDTLIKLCWMDLLPLVMAFVLLVPSVLIAFEIPS